MLSNMKKSIIILMAAILSTATISACSGNTTAETSTETINTKDATHVEIIYFHGKQRCKTCIAIENETKALFEGELAELVKSGKVRLRIVDFSTPEGKQIAKKYKVTFSSLFVVTNPGKNETAEDLTRFAFANARSNPEAFRKEVKSKVMNGIK